MNDHERAEIQRAAREAAENNAKVQGLPARITDRTVLRRVAAVLKGAPRDERFTIERLRPGDWP